MIPIKKIIFGFFLFSFFNSAAQIMVAKPERINIPDPSFNKNFIQVNKIKCLKAHITNKPDNKIIEDKGLTEVFNFDTLGNIIHHYYTQVANRIEKEIQVPVKTKKGKRTIIKMVSRTVISYTHDTTSTRFFYDKHNRLMLKRIYSNSVYTSWYYEYDSLNRVVKEIRAKETNLTDNEEDFKIGVQNIISKESFEYENLTPLQDKKKCYNDEGTLYKNIIINYDKKGNKITENDEFLVSWINTSVTFNYNVNDLLTEKIYLSNTTTTSEKINYEYDVNKNIIGIKKFKNDSQTNEISYLLDENFKLVKSMVNRDFPGKRIGIVKYEYTFY